MKAIGWMNRNKLYLILGGIVLAILLYFAAGALRDGGLRRIGADEEVELPRVSVDTLAVTPGAFAQQEESIQPRLSPRRTPGPTGTPTQIPLSSDKDRLLWITKDWVYRGFQQIGDWKRGRFTHQKLANESFHAREGEVIEKGVAVVSLDRLVAVVGLGEATHSLACVPEPEYTLEQMRKRYQDGPPSQEQIHANMTAYWENYGKRFNEAGKRYTPKPGERMPPREPPSVEQQQTARAEYLERVMPTLKARNANWTPIPGELMPDGNQSEEERNKAIDNYYKRFRPGETPPVWLRQTQR